MSLARTESAASRSGRWRSAVRVLGFVTVLGLGAGSLACSSSGERPGPPATTTTHVDEPMVVPELSTGTTAPVDGGAVGEGVAAPVRGRTPLRGFGEVQVTLTSGDGERCEVCLLSATTEEQRARGLMEVTDPALGGYDGMLFEFPEEVGGAFWMRNTPLPLSIAYFDDRGRLVSTSDMAPCGDRADCPSYPADDAFAFALEVPKGTLEDIDVVGDAVLHIDARSCEQLDTGS